MCWSTTPWSARCCAMARPVRSRSCLRPVSIGSNCRRFCAALSSARFCTPPAPPSARSNSPSSTAAAAERRDHQTIDVASINDAPKMPHRHQFADVPRPNRDGHGHRDQRCRCRHREFVGFAERRQGNLTLATGVASGLTSGQITGNGTATITITAPLAALNATLSATSGLRYQTSRASWGPTR